MRRIDRLQRWLAAHADVIDAVALVAMLVISVVVLVRSMR